MFLNKISVSLIKPRNNFFAGFPFRNRFSQPGLHEFVLIKKWNKFSIRPIQ